MKAVTKDYLREIKNTKSRFISILVLVSLSVAFLSGLRAAAPDMRSTGSNYLKSLNLADIQIISTLGITDDDVEEIIKRPEIEDAEGVYVLDSYAISETGNKIAKLYSLTEKNISNVLLKKGRMPEKLNECVMDLSGMAQLNIKLGDTIVIDTPNNEGALKYDEYTVVGAIRSPIYISYARGNCSIGTGSVATYVYVPKDSFSMDVYTSVFAKAVGVENMTAFTEEYDNHIDELVDSLRDFSVERASKRYTDVIDDANTEIDDAQKQIDDAKKQLSDAEKELADARKQLDDGWKEYYDGLKELEDAKAKVEDGRKELDDAWAQYNDGLKEIEDGEKQLKEAKKQLEDAEIQYKKGCDDYVSGINQYNSGIGQIASGYAQLANEEARFNQAVSAIDAMIDGGMPAELLSMLAGNEAAFNKTPLKKQLSFSDFCAAYEAWLYQDVYRAEIANGRAQLAAAEAQLGSASSQIASGSSQLAESRKQLDDAWEEYENGLDELEEGREELEEGKAEIEKGEIEYADGLKQYEDGKKQLEDAKSKLDDGEVEYSKGYREYLKAKNEAYDEINKGQNELDDAKSSLAKLEGCDWYVFDRGYNPGYDGLGQDAERMANLAKVFPIIFFLVAALVCLTNMTRMVEEQRILIGGMKALGYPSGVISFKYVGYGLIPSLIGSVLGLLVGYIVFPTLIFTAYQIMYELPNIELYAYPNISIMCTIFAVACTTLSSLWACLSTLRETPANLMRPKTPPAGKRVFLEYIKPLWERMSFIHKVTARNLFRYKKRFWMTVIGIAGCTALMIAGFGIKKSLTETMVVQYDQIFHYDSQVVLDTNIDKEDLFKFNEFLENDDRVTGYAEAEIMTYTARSDDGNIDAYLYVVDPIGIKEYVEIADYDTKEIITLSDDGLYVDKKLTELLNVGIGDSILIDGDDKVFAPIVGIIEQYTGHITYMTPKCYETLYEKEYQTNGYMLQMVNDTKELADEVFEDFMTFEGVLSTSRMTEMRDTFLEAMERIDIVVLTIIICSGLLALIVLYNLSDINISERRRELATIKVLGFYDNEVSAYVYRENVILTIFGIILGNFMGRALHMWLVASVEIDAVMFYRETSTSAYIYSTILTIVFAVIANLIAHVKMKKIDMVESLKSAE